jgi:drug/metabolite transporter (DMT)-like permease
MGVGRAFPRKTWLFTLMVFAGVLLANLNSAEVSTLTDLTKGAFPVLVAAFCYPTGNQLVWEAKNGNRRLPDINDPLLENPFNKVLLMSLGSLPFWLVLMVVNRPSPPSGGQLAHTALVAFFSGIVATSLFLYARNRSRRASELAAVDATQSSEVVFAMIGEVLLLGAPLPNSGALAGIALVFLGLSLFIGFQEKGPYSEP